MTILPNSWPNPFFLAGPTGSGKSRLAVSLAEHLASAVIVNADPFQAWQGLPILTAQPDAAMLARAPHHLYGFLPLDEERDAHGFSALVNQTCGDLKERGHQVIVVSGSGLYLDFLLHGADPDIPSPDPVLRASLEAMELPALCGKLLELDPEEHARVDRHNKRRVLRAVEICLLTGRTASSLRQRRDARECVQTRGIWLHWNRDALNTRIRARAVEMVGPELAAEVRALDELGLSVTAGQTLGLREACAWGRGEMDDVSLVECLQRRTTQYAKRQVTWFRKARGLACHDVDARQDWSQTARGLLEEFRA